MKSSIGIIKALAYSDLFSFPLTLGEIHKFYVGDGKITQNEIKKILISHPYINSQDGFYYLHGRKQIVAKRIAREEESTKKEKKAQRIAKILSLLPTVKMIALSGSLAQKNARENDDIDLFIVTRNNTLWTSRLFINLILIALFQKRKKNVREACNKICPNMLVTESSLQIPELAQNIYTAREIIQLRPLISKDNTYQKFLASNKWVKKILPNTRIPKISDSNKYSKHEEIIEKIDNLLFSLQRKFMQISNETVKKNIAKFHPRKTSDHVLFLYDKKLKLIEEIESKNSAAGESFMSHRHN